MTELIKRLDHDKFLYGDVVRLTDAVKGVKGRRFKFVGAVFEDGNEDPLYYDLIDIKRGHLRNIRPEFVIKDIAASKAAQALIKREAAE